MGEEGGQARETQGKSRAPTRESTGKAGGKQGESQGKAGPKKGKPVFECANGPTFCGTDDLRNRPELPVYNIKMEETVNLVMKSKGRRDGHGSWRGQGQQVAFLEFENTLCIISGGIGTLL